MRSHQPSPLNCMYVLYSFKEETQSSLQTVFHFAYKKGFHVARDDLATTKASLELLLSTFEVGDLQMHATMPGSFVHRLIFNVYFN